MQLVSSNQKETKILWDAKLNVKVEDKSHFKKNISPFVGNIREIMLSEYFPPHLVTCNGLHWHCILLLTLHIIQQQLPVVLGKLAPLIIKRNFS